MRGWQARPAPLGEEWHLHISRGPADVHPAQARVVGPTIISSLTLRIVAC